MPVSGIEPLTYWLRISCSTPELHRHGRRHFILIINLKNSSKNVPQLDPALREKLLRESKKPFAGLRRLLWITLFGSAGLGFLIMSSRLFIGDSVTLRDFGIQITALIIFASLLWFDRPTQN